MMNLSFNVNVLIDLLALFVVAAIRLSEKKEQPNVLYKRLFDWLWMTICGVLILDIPAWMLDGVMFPGARLICYILDTGYYTCQILFCYLWILFSIKWCGFVQHDKKIKYFVGIPALAEVCLILINPLTGWIFAIDEQNIYSRGNLYVYNLIPFYFYILGALFFAAAGFYKEKDDEQRRQSASLVVYMFLPIVGTILESFYYGISWIWPFTTLCLLMVYMNVQQQMMSRQRFSIIEKEKELVESRMAIMLSQIQPHFLYNTLGTIRALYRRDPLRAEQAMLEFTEFLRGNIDSLTAEKPISFEQELSHTKHYLELELMRFTDRLHIEWDIRTMEFRIPTLTLQPIVENAVHYGVSMKEEGGNIQISSYEEEQEFVVKVKDDGVGFESADADRGTGVIRSHIGIPNVRERLRTLCNGTLTIDSANGMGTTVTIRIPKERESC
ncbi:MAG: histidine kinase [bacterium]|nr:histidine kinase [bacterium]